MSEINKTFRIRTDIGEQLKTDYIELDANLVQDYNTFDILSLKINSVDTYKLHNANYGVVVGRVLANNGFGVPNAKLSIFIEADSEDGEKLRELYPFSTTAGKDRKGVRYNLLPDEKVADCHQIVGTFPNKRYALDNDVILEVFDKYYKYTTRTNNSGDYLIMGVPVGTHTLHMDLDLSDCGILSQRPRDFVYKGYTIEQFETPNMFKSGTTYSNLSQVFTQDQVVNVQPFWGDSTLGEKIGLTRADINISFKFEPTCVFLGSVISDNSSQGISKKCIPTENMGNMEELTTGEGTIEMIRKTPGGSIEEYQVKGTQLIDGNGIWCYQIPMNLDYMMTDEYGNMVPTDDPEKGIPTRTKVRFRVSMQDNEENVDNFFRAKVLVPHNPQNLENGKHEEYDYEFGSSTREDSFRDLFWNNVYTVKSYFPRFQKRKVGGWKEKKFTGIKNCNFYGSNNPIPYNNIRIKLPFMFTMICALIKVFIFIVSIMNSLTSMLGNFLSDIGDTFIGFRIFGQSIGFYPFKKLYKKALDLSMSVVKEGLCPDLENWFFAPMFKKNLWSPPKNPPKDYPNYDLLKQTLNKIREASADDDKTSIDYQNNEEMNGEGEEPICLTIYTDYLISCIEMNLAMEYRVINFDFYNDWINGTLYFPRFMRYVRPKKTFLGIRIAKTKVKGCMDDTSIWSKTRRYTQQCSLGYKNKTVDGSGVYTNVENPLARNKNTKVANNFHKQRGLSQATIFGKNGGICHEHTTLRDQHVYYMKPCEWTIGTTPNARKVNLFATDVVLLGSLNECDLNGVPQAFKYLSSTSYIMPTNLALTNMETNGELYTIDNGTICAGKSYLSEAEVRKGRQIGTLSGSKSGNSLTNELNVYGGAQDQNYDINYEGKELSDVIALTEAAGIAWNYTGPGQGEMNPEKFYYPGGHFLGLSCVNSQTNIKSCINLTRICEVGANMSQRKEDISSIDADGNITYSYTAPTGFISGDDIVGANFRTMFATMNYKPLVATRTNPSTGYKMYDFNFIKPINFDGTFNSVVYGGSSNLYNGTVEVPKENTSIWEKVGIDFNSDSRPDYDENEIVNTQTRTIEETSVDYYLFRFGLNHSQLRKSNQLHLRRFLKTDGNKLYLPQYENSYYFYFGLKNGATAIDEFNKQFFSECENSLLEFNAPSIDIAINDDINICEANANVSIIVSNIEAPYQSIEITSDVEFLPKRKNLLIVNNDDETEYDEWLTSTMFDLPKCPLGTYVITIVDANGSVHTKTAKIGGDILSFDSVAYNFNSSGDTKQDELLYRGGYIEVSNVKIDGLAINDEDEGIKAQQLELSVVQNNKIISSTTIDNGSPLIVRLPVSASGESELWVSYQCDGCEEVKFLMQTFNIKNGSYMGLYIGSPDVVSCAMTLTRHNYGWWESKLKTDDYWVERAATFNEVENRKDESSSIKVYAIGGTKAVWGCPQNNEKGILTNLVWSSEDASSWDMDGYIMDDESVHYPTYMYNGKSATPFSCLVYDNTMVMGDYEAKMINRSVSNSSSVLNAGCGYIFKPLPDGDLQFHIYNGNSYTANTTDEEEKPIEDGVFYPSIAYPSVNRTFKAETKFYCWERRALEMIADDYGDETPTIMDYEEGGRTEMTLYNGITNGKIFHSSSNITNLVGPFKVETDDMNGVTNNTDRITILSGYNKNVKTASTQNVKYIDKSASGITTYGYEIVEGTPDDAYLEMVNSIYDTTDSEFSNYVRYTTQTGADGVQRIYGPYSEGGLNNPNVSYFMVKENPSNKFLIETPQKYIYTKQGSRTYHAFATYTSAATYNEEGKPVKAVIRVGLFGNKASVSFPLKDAEENTYTYTKSKINVSSADNAAEILSAVFNACPEIQGIVDYRIRYDKNNWYDNFIKNNIIGNGSVFDPKSVYYGVGVIKGSSVDANNNATTTLYKIYPTMVRVAEFIEKDNVDVDINPSTLTFSTKGGSNTITVTGSSDIPWFSQTDSTWITVRPSTGMSSSTTVQITTSPNKDTSDRQGIVYFYDSKPEDGAMLVVIQKAIEGVTKTYKPSEYTGSGYIELQNNVSNSSEDGSKIIYDNFDFTDNLGIETSMELPDIIIETLDYKRGLNGATYDNYMDFSIYLKDSKGDIVQAAHAGPINTKETISFDNFIFTPRDANCKLEVVYYAYCGDTNITNTQYLNYKFSVSTNQLKYIYTKE